MSMSADPGIKISAKTVLVCTNPTKYVNRITDFTHLV